MIRNKSPDELMLMIGQSVPDKSIELLREVRSSYERRLPAVDRKVLPAATMPGNKQQLGARAHAALKRIAWRAICDPTNHVHRAWSEGLALVYDKKVIATAIVGVLGSYKITATVLAASMVALAIRLGADTFCEMFAPESLMIGQDEKD